MAIPKWSWTDTNPYINHPGIYSPYIKFGASAEETQKAYQALINKGPTSDFSYMVWNDLCAKISDLNKDWQTEYYFGNIPPFVWMKSPRREDYPDGETYVYEQTRTDGTWGRITHQMMNKMAKGLIPTAIPPWTQRLGRDTIQAGDICYADYFLWIVDTVNHWCDLVPMWWSITGVFTFGYQGKVEVWLVLPFSFQLDALFDSRSNIQPGDGIQALVFVEWKLGVDANVVLYQPVYVIGLMNFMTLDIQCKVWDKEIIYVIPQLLEGRMGDDIRLVQREILPFHISDRFQHGQDFHLKLSSDLQAMCPRLHADYYGTAGLQLTSPFPLLFHDSFSHSGTVKVRRTARPVPIAAWTPFQSDARIRVEFEGINMLEMEPGALRVQGHITHDVDTSRISEQKRKLCVYAQSFDITDTDAVSMEPDAEQIVIHRVPEELKVGVASPVSHRERVKTKKEISLLSNAPSSMGHTGAMQKVRGGGELSFANEESLTVRSGAIGVTDGGIDLAFQDTQAMDFDGKLGTQEQIGISEDPPLPMEGEATVSTECSGRIDRDQVLEHAADATIQTLSLAEIQFNMNKILETESVAARTSSIAAMYVRRYFHLVSEEELSSREYGILDKRIRRLMESSNTTATKEKGELLLRLIRFASGGGTALATSEAEAVRTLPRHTVSMKNYVMTGVNAFLDAGYVRGDSLVAEPTISVVTDVGLSRSEIGGFLSTAEKIAAIVESELQRAPTRSLFGGEIAQTGSDAKLVMARSKLVLALEYEETLVMDLEEVNAADAERHLVFI